MGGPEVGVGACDEVVRADDMGESSYEDDTIIQALWKSASFHVPIAWFSAI